MALSASHKKRAMALKKDWVIGPQLEQYRHDHPNAPLVTPQHLKTVVDLMVANNHRAQGWHPSAIFGCQRAQVFEYLGIPPKSKESAGSAGIFLDGHWRHIKWQATLLAAGVLRRVEVPLHNKELRIVGRADGEGFPWLTYPDWIFEAKGTAKFDEIKAYGAMPPHIRQVHAYFLAHGAINTGVILYECKTTNQTHEIIIREKRAIRNEIIEIVGELNEAVEDGKLPEILEECRYGEGAYKRCAWAYACKQVRWEEAWEAVGCKTSEEVIVKLGLTRRNSHEQKPADYDGGEGRAVAVRFAPRTRRVSASAVRQR